MCGIAGIYNFDKHNPTSAVAIQRMTNSLSHRGPDGDGFYVKGNVALGHRRLAIIDLLTGDQPMYSEDGKIVIVFNGEIYNYKELREELIKDGYKFNTQSDTEVIINAYRKWGVEVFGRFNGMWALAIWDDREKQLILCRDRIGEKPLFYYQNRDTLLFASEIKGILEFGTQEIINYQYLELYLHFGYIPAPYSFYQDIYKVLPGEYLLIKENRLKKFKYWDIEFCDEKEMREDAETIHQEFEDLLRNSVSIRMRSDVPLGAFLSGGLDSSCIVALMSEESSSPIETFTVGYENAEYDERYLASLVAKKFNTRHKEIIYEKYQIEDSLQEVLRNFDEPFGDSSAVPTGYISKCVRKNVKLALTGDGGDEVLSGYTLFQGQKFTSIYKKIPFALRAGIPPILSVLKKVKKNKYPIERASNVIKAAGLEYNDWLISKLSWSSVEFVAELLHNHKNQYTIKEFMSDTFAKVPYKDDFYKTMWFMIKVPLPDDMLTKVDRSSMAHGLEVRTPFLDYRLVDLMTKVDKNIKMKRFQRKSVLRNTVAQKLPGQLLRASKKGFGVPIRDWFKEDIFNKSVRECLIPSKLESKTVKRIINQNMTGTKDWGNLLWMLMVLENKLKSGAE